MKSRVPKFGLSNLIPAPRASHSQLIAKEGELGGKLFGPTQPGQKRQFFCLNDHTWVFHQEWVDAEGAIKYLHTIYEVRRDGVFKSQNGGSYRKISESEAQNLLEAVKLYEPYVMEPLYGAVAQV